MSWQKYTPVVNKRSVPVSITVPSGVQRPTLFIDEATIKALGWTAGATLMLSIGHNEHEGKLRLEPAVGEPLQLRAPKPKAKRKRNHITLGVELACEVVVGVMIDAHVTASTHRAPSLPPSGNGIVRVTSSRSAARTGTSASSVVMCRRDAATMGP